MRWWIPAISAPIAGGCRLSWNRTKAPRPRRPHLPRAKTQVLEAGDLADFRILGCVTKGPVRGIGSVYRGVGGSDHTRIPRRITLPQRVFCGHKAQKHSWAARSGTLRGSDASTIGRTLRSPRASGSGGHSAQRTTFLVRQRTVTLRECFRTQRPDLNRRFFSVCNTPRW